MKTLLPALVAAIVTTTALPTYAQDTTPTELLGKTLGQLATQAAAAPDETKPSSRFVPKAAPRTTPVFGAKAMRVEEENRIPYRRYDEPDDFYSAIKDGPHGIWSVDEYDIGRTLNQVAGNMEPEGGDWIRFNAQRSGVREAGNGEVSAWAEGNTWITMQGGARAFGIDFNFWKVSGLPITLTLLDAEFFPLVTIEVPYDKDQEFIGLRTNEEFHGVAFGGAEWRTIMVSREPVFGMSVCVGQTTGMAIFYEGGFSTPTVMTLPGPDGAFEYIPEDLDMANPPVVLAFPLPGGDLVDCE